MPPIPVVFGLIAFAGVFLFFLGVSQMRRAAGGSEDFQALLAAYGVTTAGAAALPQSAGMRDTLNRLFQPAADAIGRGDAQKGKPPVTGQLQPPQRHQSPRQCFLTHTGTGSILCRTVGGNLAEILDNIAYTIRERVRIKGEIQTLTAQARASGSIITALPILLAAFMFFVTPTYFQPMFSNVIGWALIIVACFLIFIGNLIIRRVVAIEV